MRSRRVRVPGSPVDFHVPAGWPTPTDRWVQDNVFWQPPEGWAPRTDLPTAPHGWRYWVPNPAWRNATAPVYRPIRRWSRGAIVLAAPGILLVVISLFTPVSPVGAVFGWMFAAMAAACLTVFGTLHHRITQRVLVEAASVAAQERRARMRDEYQRYRQVIG